MIDYLVFDLDGTLIDTLTGITEALNVTLNELHFGLSYNKETVKTFIGRGAKRLFDLGTKGDKNPADFALFLKNYEKCQYISEPFDGVKETLKELNSNGIKIIVYSNKPNEILQKLMSNKLGDIEFLYLQGQDKKYPPKPDVILLKKILDKFNLNSKNGMYVGDSIVDIFTANNIKMKSIILSYGYGNYDEMMAAKPDYYIDDFKEILKIIKEN